MFDLIHSLEEHPGEVEMVSLVPVFEEEPEGVIEPEVEAEPEVVVEPEVEAETEVVIEPEIEAEAEVELEPEIIEETQVERASGVTDEKVAMSRSYQISGEKIEIAYINYNKVRILRGESAPEIKEFASTKEAVDYYVEKMQEFEADE